jgi:hypothetical protein
MNKRIFTPKYRYDTYQRAHYSIIQLWNYGTLIGTGTRLSG